MDPNDFCCCGTVHVKAGVQIISTFTLLGGIILILGSPGAQDYAPLTLSVGIIYIALASLAIHGVRKGKPGCLVPYMIKQVINIVTCVVILIICLVPTLAAEYFIDMIQKAAASANPEMKADLDGFTLGFRKPDAPFLLHLIAILPTACASIFLFLEVYIFILFGKCHRHLKAYTEANEAYIKLIERDGQLQQA
ncbi:hypothetical protein L596_022397 [Steinernema carpocapsae]|uniref:Uncharacterized protein n=1 Tax=Steinernema carpocapsae TaxID=34508 RepID=A0A4U5MLL4_STECR|nr:hypothetical protein L596_022397 [Steinernema carpocapsae]